MGIFKAYDVRGFYPSELNEEIAYKIGRAFIQQFNLKEVVIGRDGRIGSPELSKALIQGMTDQGADATDIGQCTTPALYFATAFYEFEGGLMITASHLGKESNGIKFVLDEAKPLGYETGLNIVEQLVKDNHFKQIKEKGMIEKKDITNDYQNHLKGFIDEIKNLNIVVDFSNGVETLYFERVAQNFKNCKLHYLNKRLDGSFPGHEPNPADTKNMEQACNEVKKQRADLGIVFDGDSDRAGFIDELGNPIPGDIITLLIALSYPDKEGEAVVYDINSSKVVPEVLEKHNKIPIISPTGQVSIKGLMRKHNAFLGGEFSGHYTYRDNYFSDSGIITALRLLHLVSMQKEQGNVFSDFIKPFKKYYSTGQINLEIKDKDKKMKEIEKLYEDANNVTKIDGLFIEYDDWWFKVRKSNTEDIIRLSVEAKTKDLMEMKKRELMELIEG